MVFQRLEGTPLLVCRLLYGSGMRVLEALRLRVKDLDFGANQIVVREGKGRTWCFPVQSGKRADPATCTLAHEKIDFDYVALVAVLADFQLAT